MGELIVSEPLASQIRREAEAQGTTVEALLETALRHARFEAQRRKIQAESAWWRSLPAEARARYAGQFVAVHNQAVIDYDRDEETLRKRIRAKYAKTPILLTPAERRREYRIVSTHLARP
jgi:hypothetical protein